MTDISAVPGLTEVDLSVSGPDELERATLALSRHGLVVARNAVRPGTIRAFRAQLCERMTQAEGAPVSWGGLRRGVSQERVLLMRRAAYDCPHLATLFRSPRLLDLMGHVLDTYEPFLHPRKWMRSSRARGDEKRDGLDVTERPGSPRGEAGPGPHGEHMTVGQVRGLVFRQRSGRIAFASHNVSDRPCHRPRKRAGDRASPRSPSFRALDRRPAGVPAPCTCRPDAGRSPALPRPRERRA